MSEVRFISAEEVKKSLTMSKAIEAMRQAFADLSSGKAQVPERLPLHTGDDKVYLFMPAYFPSGNITTVKSVSINGQNPARGLPFIHANILVFDHDNGVPMAVVDGSAVTSIRTAAASGLATQLFSNPDSRVAAIFGTGVQAHHHLEALTVARDIERIYVYGRSIDKSNHFCEEFNMASEAELVATDQLDNLRDVDVICTTTTSSTPLFEHEYLKPGVHINAVGVYKAEDQEISEETVMASNIFIDQIDGVMSEAGDLLIPFSKGLITKDHFSKEIGRVVLGEEPYTWNPSGFSLFKSVGNAIQDAAAVKILL